MSSPTAAPTGDARSVAGYFKALSTVYACQTGDSTYDFVHSFLSKLSASELSSTAVIHDNACGVGTATMAILVLTAGSTPPQLIHATDSSEGMITQLQAHLAEDQQPSHNVHPAVEDSHKLPFADNTFTLSVTNIGVTNIADPAICLHEVHRTLQPGGRAIVSIWKRFTAAELTHQAQQAIKGPAVQLMKIPKAECFQDSYLRDRMVEAGFCDVQQTFETTIIKGEALPGLKGFMNGRLTTSARAGRTDEDHARWSGAIDDAVANEAAQHAGAP